MLRRSIPPTRYAIAISGAKTDSTTTNKAIDAMTLPLTIRDGRSWVNASSSMTFP